MDEDESWAVAVCEWVRKGRQCGSKRTEPRKEAVRTEDPRDDDERIFGPCEGTTVNVKEIAHCAVLKEVCEKEKLILLFDVGGREMVESEGRNQRVGSRGPSE
jgi:hypothetical protein